MQPKFYEKETTTPTVESVLYDSLEEEYKTVGWMGIVRIMRFIAMSPNINSPKENDKSEDAFLIEFCEQVNKNPNLAINMIEKWQQTPNNNRTRLDMLQRIGILERDTYGELAISQAFADALYIENYDDSSIVEFIEMSKLERHEPVLSQSVEFCSKKILESYEEGKPITPSLEAIVRDINFYVGFYDR